MVRGEIIIPIHLNALVAAEICNLKSAIFGNECVNNLVSQVNDLTF